MTDSVAIVFPGQGSQKLGMLSGIAEQYLQVGETFDEASQALGYDLWSIVQSDEEKLNQTQYTQPALLTASIAMWRIAIETQQITPAFLAGHSLGEYTALVVAEAISFSDAVQVVALRGKFMQSAVPAGSGAMAACLGLDDHTVSDICQQAAQGQVLAPVNFNSPGQVVIAGEKSAVERAIPLVKEAGARKVVLLPVSVPSHCDLMLPAAEQLSAVLADVSLQLPKYRVVHNVDVSVQSSVDAIRQALVNQLSQPVRWVETIQFFARNGVDIVLECGPGKVLTGLNKRIDKNLQYNVLSV